MRQHNNSHVAAGFSLYKLQMIFILWALTSSNSSTSTCMFKHSAWHWDFRALCRYLCGIFTLRSGHTSGGFSHSHVTVPFFYLFTDAPCLSARLSDSFRRPVRAGISQLVILNFHTQNWQMTLCGIWVNSWCLKKGENSTHFFSFFSF